MNTVFYTTEESHADQRSNTRDTNHNIQTNAKLTPRNPIARKFISHQIHTKPLVTNITIPISIRPNVQTNRGVFTLADFGGVQVEGVDAGVGVIAGGGGLSVGGGG